MLVLGAYVTDTPNDKQQLVPAVKSVPAEVREVTKVLADGDFFERLPSRPWRPAAARRSIRPSRRRAIIARSPILWPPEPETPIVGVINKEAMRLRLRTVASRAAYFYQY